MIDLVFDYDQAGNLTEVHDELDEFNQTFAYDALHRISTAESPRYPAPLNFTYDAASVRRQSLWDRKGVFRREGSGSSLRLGRVA